MTRARTTIDYFPHHCEHGRVIYILEKYWGNDGYAVFYKLLEQLGSTSGHYLDFRKSDRWEYFLAVTLMSEGFVIGILDKLAEMELIDKDLWGKRIVWAQFFVDSLKEVYQRRKNPLPTKPVIDEVKPVQQDNPTTTTPLSGKDVDNMSTISPLNGEDVDISPTQLPLNPQSKVNKSKVNKNKRKKVNKERKDYSLSFLEFYDLYPRKESKYEAFESWNLINPDNGMVTKIITAVKNQFNHKKKLTEAKLFCPEWPLPVTWLNQRRWEDDIPQVKSAVPKAQESAHTVCPNCKQEVLKNDLEGYGCIKCGGEYAIR